MITTTYHEADKYFITSFYVGDRLIAFHISWKKVGK
jgi:hypothetical protein